MRLLGAAVSTGLVVCGVYEVWHALSDRALLEWTWDGRGETTAAGLQQLTVTDCMFHGNARCDYGFRVARSPTPSS